LVEISESNGITNRILLALPESTLGRLRSVLVPMVTEKGQILDRVDGPIEHMYFVNRGLVSVVKTMRDGRVVEIGTVGVEGVTDPNALFGVERAVLETMVQIPGTAFAIKRDHLRREMARDGILRAMMERYARFAYSQIAQTSACNQLHSIEERCARWLLIAHDSALSDTFTLTHEFLAMMLGVRRVGVTIVANGLKKAGLIDYVLGNDGRSDAADIAQLA
jgi:cAMP-binding proteins - catabolite gene activator and regulatory subunit of cAMP-dependent protein kinases